jgi:hypothetical protein
MHSHRNGRLLHYLRIEVGDFAFLIESERLIHLVMQCVDPLLQYAVFLHQLGMLPLALDFACSAVFGLD